MLQKIRSFILSSFLLLLSVLFLSGCVTSTLRSVDVSRIQSIQGTVFYKGDISNPDAIVVDAAGGLMMKTGSDWMQAYGSEAETLTQKLLSQGYDPKAMIVINDGQESQEGIFAAKKDSSSDKEITYSLSANLEKGIFRINETISTANGYGSGGGY